MENKKQHLKISTLVFTTVAVIASMAAILVHERERIREIEAESAEVQQVRRNINAAHRHITRLATLGESVIGWNEADSTCYRTLRLRTDSLLQALKPYCRDYVRPAQIDTLRTLLSEKEAHLLHLMEILARQDEADSLLVNHLPEVARRATRIRTVKQKKSGLAGLLGGKKTIQLLPSAKELYQFSDSLIALQQRQTAEMDAYADSLRNRNRTLNRELNRFVSDLDTQAQTAFGHRERKIAEAQALSVRLFTITISAAIVLLFLSYLAIHREMKHKDHERKRREKLIDELQESNEANEKLIKLRRNLIQNVTHELRTPLAAISGNAELLLNDTEEDNRMRHAQTIHDAATAAGYVEGEELKRKGFAAVLYKPYSIDELLAVTESCIKRDKTSRIDLLPLLAFGDKRRTLEKLATTTQSDMDEVRKAAEAKDMEALDGWVHHLRSSWMLIKAEQPLVTLYDAIHKKNISDEELSAAVGAVLAQGKLIIDLARKEAERWVE